MCVSVCSVCVCVCVQERVKCVCVSGSITPWCDSTASSPGCSQSFNVTFLFSWGLWKWLGEVCSEVIYHIMEICVTATRT